MLQIDNIMKELLYCCWVNSLCAVFVCVSFVVVKGKSVDCPTQVAGGWNAWPHYKDTLQGTLTDHIVETQEILDRIISLFY